jgi:methyltransferase (TIGR00027 family)
MEIANVTGTAFVVAEFRADENRAARPLYRDPVVPLFLTEQTHDAAARLAARFPPLRNMVKLRTRYFDDALDLQVRQGCRQVLILGAGLDTRAVRKPFPDVTYFEIDDVATLGWKQNCYRRHRIEPAVRLIPGDYLHDGLLEMLIRHGFALEVPTYVIWEGNTMYLPRTGVRFILAQLASALTGFRVSFDYVSDAVVAGTTGDPAIGTLVETFAAMGAPWVTGFADPIGFGRDLGLDVVENVSTATLHARYWGHGPLTSAIFDHYSICTLAL